RHWGVHRPAMTRSPAVQGCGRLLTGAPFAGARVIDVDGGPAVVRVLVEHPGFQLGAERVDRVRETAGQPGSLAGFRVGVTDLDAELGEPVPDPGQLQADLLVPGNVEARLAATGHAALLGGRGHAAGSSPGSMSPMAGMPSERHCMTRAALCVCELPA